MPVDGVEFIKRGYTNLKILQSFNFGAGQENEHYKNKIDVILMPADTMYDWYLENQKMGDEFENLLLFVGNENNYGQTHNPTTNS